MRRFITSLPGKVIGQVVIAALILPFITLALFTRANAQIATLPSWAVTEFVNRKSPGTTFGQKAADAFASELGKSGEIDVVASDSIKRAVENLGIASPPDSKINLLRLAQEVHSTSVVAGELVDYKVLNVAGGKQATVAMKISVYDVSSGLTVNGAALRGVSSIRAGNVADETLINDAITTAAGQAMRQIQAHKLPTATVLNTQLNKALINKGQRSGFSSGQQVIVSRNGAQVATGKITDVEPDSAYVVGSNIERGIQPGDKVRVVFLVPDIDVAGDGSVSIHPV